MLLPRSELTPLLRLDELLELTLLPRPLELLDEELTRLEELDCWVLLPRSELTPPLRLDELSELTLLPRPLELLDEELTRLEELDCCVLLPRSELTPPLRLDELSERLVLVLPLLPRLEVLPLRSELMVLELLARSLLVVVPRPVLTSERSGAVLVEREPVARSVVVMVLLPRVLVMRLPLRCSAGLLRMLTWEREVVILPTRGRLL